MSSNSSSQDKVCSKKVTKPGESTKCIPPPDRRNLELVNDKWICNVQLKAGARLTFTSDLRELYLLLVPKVNEAFNFYVEPTGHLSAALEISRTGVAAKAIAHSTVCPRLVAIVDAEIFHQHQPSSDLTNMRATTKKSKIAFFNKWHESEESQQVFFVKCNKYAVDFIRNDRDGRSIKGRKTRGLLAGVNGYTPVQLSEDYPGALPRPKGQYRQTFSFSRLVTSGGSYHFFRVRKVSKKMWILPN